MKISRRALALLLIVSLVTAAGCHLPGLPANTRSGIVIAGGNYAERQICTAIVEEMIRHEMPDVPVSVINNLGSATLVNQSMVHGDANVLGCMYTGTSLTGELGGKPIRDPEKAQAAVVRGYKEKFGAKWYPSFGFANTYAFMVSRELAEREHLTKVSDLKRLKDTLRVGVDANWMAREGDGYKAFQKFYGFSFKKISSMEIGLVYSAVHAGEMDVVLGYSTDGRIDAYDLVLLEDDLHLFPPYNASPVATYEALEKYPELDGVLRRLAGILDEKQMQKLNRLSDEKHLEPQVIAKDFLEAHDYFQGKKATTSKGGDQ